MVMNFYLPVPLKKGNTIGIISPSFFIEKEENAKRGFETLKDLGFNLKYSESVFKKFYNTTATAEQRAKEINAMFLDKDIDAIICTDGGCRAVELLPLIDYDIIKENPKIFIGFSDITHLLLAIYAKTGVPMLHGLDIINGFGQSNDFSCKIDVIDHFNDLTQKETKGTVIPAYTTRKILRPGLSEGILIGGWIEAINNLSGTSYFPDEQEIILFYEAISLEQNKIMMILNSLSLAPWFKNVRGILVGKLTDCEEKEYYDCISSLEDTIIQIADKFNFPVIADVDFGHVNANFVLPIGIRCRIDTDKNTIELMDNYTRTEI